MAAFNPIKTGGWAFGEILTSGQMNQINTDFPFALNGRDGGSYTMSNSLVLATAVGKVISLNGTVIDDTGALAAAAVINAAHGLQVTGLANVTGDLVVSGQGVFGDAIFPNGVVKRRASLSVTTSVTINTTTKDFLSLTGASAACNLTLGVPSASTGYCFEIRCSALSYAQTIKSNGGATLVTMQGTSGTVAYAAFIFNGTEWELCATRIVP